MKQNVFFINFKGLFIEANTTIFLKGENPTLKFILTIIPQNITNITIGFTISKNQKNIMNLIICVT